MAAFRKVVGATNPLQAEPGTIRGDLARVIGRNIVHASDSPAAGAKESGARSIVAPKTHNAFVFTFSASTVHGSGTTSDLPGDCPARKVQANLTSTSYPCLVVAFSRVIRTCLPGAQLSTCAV